ncbi:MAG: hypothetical protein GY757_37900, partial [bacterium]|nr:hypothetical protein [bacterium]
ATVQGQGSGAPAISSPPSAGAANFLDTIGIDIEIQAHLVDLTQGPRPRIQGQGSGAPAISLPPSAALPTFWIHTKYTMYIQSLSISGTAATSS